MVFAMKRVLVFTIHGHPEGEAALAYFAARGVAVDVRDIGQDPEASLELVRRLGRLGVPTIVIEDRVFPGWAAHRPAIEALLRE
jgi:glutaredoxin